MMLFEMTDEQLDEVFDGGVGKYRVVNLLPKTKVPYVLNIQVPGSENLALRFCNFTSKGDSAKQVKPGDKFMQTQVIQISEKGTPQILRDGLGSDPIGAMNMITDEIVNMLVRYRMDATLLMFPTKALKGQAKNIARITSRLLQKTIRWKVYCFARIAGKRQKIYIHYDLSKINRNHECQRIGN